MQYLDFGFQIRFYIFLKTVCTLYFGCILQYGYGGSGNTGGIGMYGVGGAASRPMAWAGGGSTKPPMVNNYLDSHGLNAGLGNSAHTQFPSVVDTKPMQVSIFLCKLMH